MRLWILRDILRDDAAHVSSGGAEITFSADDVRKRIDELDAKALEARNASQKTSKAKSQTAAELLSAMLNRYKPENFLTCYIPGKPDPVKDKQDMFTLNVEIGVNSKLYKDSFVPDLEQVLDQISAVKKNGLLIKKKNELRNIAAIKPVTLKETVIFQADGLGEEYSVAVFDKPDRFGCTVYQFKKEEDDKILNNETGILAQFRSRIAGIKGFEIALTDENDSQVDSTKQTTMLSFLLTDNVIRDNVWAFHPTLMQYKGMYCYVPLYIENSQVTIPLRFEIPKEFQEITRNVHANRLTDEEFSSAWLKTHKGLRSASLNYLTKGAGVARSLFEEAGEEHPLSLAALQTIETSEILADNNLLLTS